METKKRLLIFSDGFDAEELKLLPHPHCEVTCVRHGDRARLLELIPDYDAYMTTLKIRVDREVLDRAPRLRLVVTPSTGTDHLDLPLLQERGVTVLSNKHERALLDQITTTAELAFGLLLTCARQLPQCFEATRAGRWEREKMAGRQIRDKTLGIVGLGRLGSMMARYGQGFWMKVIAADPFLAAFPPGVEKVDLPTLLQRSDFVSLHVHLTDQTQQLLGAKELGLMKRGVCLINTSRGRLIDEAALIREMEAGRIAAAGLDVIDGEWLENKKDHPLIAYSRKNPHLYITPHVGGTSPEAVQMVMRFTFQKAVAHLNSAAASA